jgi:cyclophilin family peptidyl-prolyl cis-trans isomerase
MRGCFFAISLAAISACRRSPPAADALGPPAPAIALAGLGPGPIAVTLQTDAGAIHCSLDPARAPGAVALFVGLATGRAAWREPASQAVTTRPLYRDRAFFRAIPGVMIQSGDPRDDGTGHPGYRIPIEARPDDRAELARPGALVLARYTPPPGRSDPHPPPAGHLLGSQFAILLTDMSHLAGQTTVLGHCGDLAVVAVIAEAVARAPAAGLRGPTLLRVTVP